MKTKTDDIENVWLITTSTPVTDSTKKKGEGLSGLLVPLRGLSNLLWPPRHGFAELFQIFGAREN